MRRQTNYIPEWPSTYPVITEITLMLKVEVKFWKGCFEETRDLTTDTDFHISFVGTRILCVSSYITTNLLTSKKPWAKITFESKSGLFGFTKHCCTSTPLQQQFRDPFNEFPLVKFYYKNPEGSAS
jgi:hypothetical protein